MPKLKITLPETGEVTHELVDEVITVGRLPENSIQIDDASVSSRHAQLTLVEGGNYFLKDLDSTNGTRSNGNAVTEVQLKNGDRVRFGKIEAAYYSEGAPVHQPLPAPEMPVAQPAAKSQKPTGFENASPFQKKSKETDPISKSIMAFAVLAILLFVGAVVTIFSIQPPVLPLP
jgi:pSer/pThr/pTyr-binding forkhead associated (FHA) protein